MTACRLGDCDNEAGKPGTSQGLCSAHYHRLKRYGDPEGGAATSFDPTDLEPVDLAYAAGFVDADGCILIQRSKSSRQHHGFAHTPIITGYNTDRRPLELLRQLFGGDIQTRRVRVAGHSVGYAWRISGVRAIDAARALMPYLRRKGLQAYLLSCFEYEARWSRGGSPSNAQMPDEEFERREQLWREMRGTNSPERQLELPR